MSTPLHVSIETPCQENWQHMTPNEQGRFCLSCQKTVVDFTLMSDKEILQYLSLASGGVCGRFNNVQLDKTYQEQPIKRKLSWKYIWNVLVAGFLLSANDAKAQGEVKKRPVLEQQQVDTAGPIRHFMGKPAIIREEKQLVTISGYVISDMENEPIVGATVSVNGAIAYAITDEDGRFTLRNINKDSCSIMVSCIGFDSKQLNIAHNTSNDFTIRLNSRVTEMGIVMVTKVTKKTPTPKNEKDRSHLPADNSRTIQVYPNPSEPGNILNGNLTLKEQGDFKLELLDTEGKLVYTQSLSVLQKSQSFQLPTQASWSKGIYWLRVTSSSNKKVYNAKVLLQ